MKRFQWISLAVAAAMALAGCSQAQSAATTAASTAAVSTAEATAGQTQTTASTAPAGTAADGSTAQTAQTAGTASELFSDRDYETDYDESTAVQIRLNGSRAEADADSVQIDGSTVTITDEGTYVLSGTLDDGMIRVEAENTDKIRIILNGVTISSSTSAPIYVKQADKVFITLAAGTTNTLTNGGTFTAIDENDIDAVIFSKDDLTINGSGSLTVQSPAGHGAVSKDDLVITGGAIQITAAGHGLSANDSIRIADGSFRIQAGSDGLEADNDTDATLGFVYISGGQFDITAGADGINASSTVQIDGGDFTISAVNDDGLHADGNLTVNGGSIAVTESFEGLEGLSLDINGGTIRVTASDDGLNAAGGNDQSGMGNARGTAAADSFAASGNTYIRIAGGSLTVNADGDGLDVNGTLTVSGGETYINGPTNSGNGALDYDGAAVITGGTFVAVGSSGMAMNFGTDSTQGSILASVGTQSAGTAVRLSDSTGTNLLEWTADKTFDSILISTPALKQGETYTLTAGSTSTEITLDTLISGGGQGMMPGGMGGQGMAPGGMNGQGMAPGRRGAAPGSAGNG